VRAKLVPQGFEQRFLRISGLRSNLESVST
jgi:hypothetical protein